MRRLVGIALTVLVFSAVFGVMGGAGAATSASGTDPLNDNPDGFDPHGDITSYALSYAGGNWTASVTVQTFDDPTTSPAWTQNGSGVEFAFDTTNDQFPEYVALLLNSGSGLNAQVYDFNNPGARGCPAIPSFDAAAMRYSITFPPSCVGDASQMSLSAFVEYLTGDPSAPVESQDITDWTAGVMPPVVHKAGYWMLGAAGQVYGFGQAQNLGSATYLGWKNGNTAVAITARADGKGYWVVGHDGRVWAFGTATLHGDHPSLPPGEFVTTMSATPTGNGYWLFTNRGGVFPYGDARFHGDLTDVPLNGPVVASIATPFGLGYYMVASDGGIFAFGDARFRGSMGGVHLNRPVVGIAPTPTGKGYWLVASDGGVFAFGDAPFHGSMAGTPLSKPVNGLVAFGNGYLMVASDGGVFDFSNKPFFGSLGGHPPAAPIIGIAAFST